MKKPILRLTAFILCSLVILGSCSKEEDKTPVATIVGEAAVTSHTAILSATFDDKGSPVTSAGFYWSRKPNPTAADSVIQGEVLMNMFTASLEDLPQGETFYYTAFATSGEGTGVSAPKPFTLVHNVPQIELLMNDMVIDDQVTVNVHEANSFTVNGSMQVTNDLVSLSRLHISFISNNDPETIVDLLLTSTTTEYTSDFTFSSPGEVELIFDLYDEYDNLTTRKVTVIIL